MTTNAQQTLISQEEIRNEKKVESGFDKSLKGEQSFPPKLFRVNVIFNATMENEREELIEVKNEQS